MKELISVQLLETATSLSSAALHEAAGKRGALPASIKPLAPNMRVCGRALPVQCASGDNLWIFRALAIAEPQDVLVVATAEGGEFGYWGEILGTLAQSLDIAGFVIDGGVRDSQALIQLQLPTFSRSVSIRGTTKEPHCIGSVGERIVIGDVVIGKGDLVVGDGDGLVALPKEHAESAVDAAIAREKYETELLDKIRKGTFSLDSYKNY